MKARLNYRVFNLIWKIYVLFRLKQFVLLQPLITVGDEDIRTAEQISGNANAKVISDKLLGR